MTILLRRSRMVNHMEKLGIEMMRDLISLLDIIRIMGRHLGYRKETFPTRAWTLKNKADGCGGSGGGCGGGCVLRASQLWAELRIQRVFPTFLDSDCGPFYSSLCPPLCNRLGGVLFFLLLLKTRHFDSLVR